MHARTPIQKRLMAICSINADLLRGLKTYDDFAKAFYKNKNSDNQLPLAVATAIEYGLPGIMLLLAAYIADIKKRQNDGEPVSGIVVDAYTWASVAELLFDKDPDAKRQLGLAPGINHSEEIKKLKQAIMAFAPDIQEKWYVSARSHASRLVQETLLAKSMNNSTSHQP